MKLNVKSDIKNKNTYLGIELGSTRIKAVLIGSDNYPIAQGVFGWENKFENGYWTYSLDNIHKGVKACFCDLVKNVKEIYDENLTSVGSIGISAMMHGILAFDEKDNLLTPFRTWRNTTASVAAKKLTEEFHFNIPERWTIAHLYQSILDDEEYVSKIKYVTTLAGYIHYILTGKKVLGIGDASGMFPIDSKKCDYDENMLSKFDNLIKDKNYGWKIKDILPKALIAGEDAGSLTKEGAMFLESDFEEGILLCPPEGDAGTGMVATNSIMPKTGNVSAGTSVFAMLVLDNNLKDLHTQIDMVTTPEGKDVAMVHANNCTSDINAWANLFGDFLKRMNIECDMSKIFECLYSSSLLGDENCGNLLSYGYLSGESITGFEEGSPMLIRNVNSVFDVANLMKTNLFSAIGALRIGLDILVKEENVKIEKIVGHGGWFKTKDAGQVIMASAINTPVTVTNEASEGGAWGMALLASYAKNKENYKNLDEFLSDKVFKNSSMVTKNPDKDISDDFERFLERYKKGLEVERKAVEFYKTN